MADKIRLLILTHNYPRYKGDFSGVFISLLAQQLQQFNVQPIVLAPHDTQTAEYEEIDGVKIYRFRYADDDKNEVIAYRGNMHKVVLGSVSGLFRFRHFLKCFQEAAFEIIEKEKINIIAGHWLVPSGIVMKRIAKHTKLPMIMSSHGTDIRLMNKWGKTPYRYFKHFCRKLKRWTVVSRFLKEQILALDSQLEDLIEILPLPHDETIFYRDKAIKKENNLIVSVTRFIHQKRVDYLIKAFAEVVKQKPEVRLHLYGSGALQSDMERLIAKMNLVDRISIFPPVPQSKLREVYNKATMVVLNSYQEGFGLALSEAMLCGAPVVGTDSGGITDIIKNRERGLLVETDNITALAEGILLLLNDNNLRKELAEKGYLYAQENYSSSSLAKRYAEIAGDARLD
ncbi:MAG: glycosyltransferase family 4 protein [FCB group bacterium]|nr:glycosyltransferase family 4 protein [FCB group bacterium]